MINKSKESKSGKKLNGIIDIANVKEQINQKLKEEQLD